MPDFLAERAYIENECRGRGWSVASLSRDTCRIGIPALSARNVPGPHLILSQPDDPKYKIQVRLRDRAGVPADKGLKLSDPSVTAPLRKDWRDTFLQAAGWAESYISQLPEPEPGPAPMPAWMAEAKAAIFPHGGT